MAVSNGASSNVPFCTDIESYYPTIKHLFALKNGRAPSTRIGSIWLVEAANHGDSALLNEKTLKDHFSMFFPFRNYGLGIVTFMTSGLVDTSDPRLVNIGHCGGSTALIFALDILLRSYGLNSTTVVLIEPALFDRRVSSGCHGMAKRVRNANNKRERAWKALDDAMAYTSKKSPWNTWHPDVMECVRREFFKVTPGEITPVSVKTPPEQESAIFDAEGCMESTPILLSLAPLMPVNIVLAERHNMWTQDMYENIADIITNSRPNIASVRVVPKAGHCAAQDNPLGVSTALLDILSETHTRRQSAGLVSYRL
ncbi:hypothetical protein EIP91_003421 [Steccherinum ochraceum]|uniref:AB hydrolase-1 domain-containing protein n=1 Tax=Steccherinum ochraceum TaxID=92696 RepID=A0A4R0RR67_9APHY|nr:hypothetical protein EIP91_003421 [Steccherinum ochraceum]